MYHIFANTPIWRPAVPQMKDGGIANQYKGKNIFQVWSEWTPKQRTHFLYDHREEIGGLGDGEILKLRSVSDAKKLPQKVQDALAVHIVEGQYSDGGQAGRLCPVGTKIQTLLFDKGKFSEAEAKKWASGHDFKTSVDEKANTYRMRQAEPSDFSKGSFRTITLKSGIKAVIGCPKDKKADGGVAAIVKQANLYFQEGTSDKEYHIQLEPKGSGYVVNFQFGRRGGPLQEGTKTSSPVSLEEAEKIYEKLKKEKTKKGYTEK